MFDRNDIQQCENLIRALKKAKFELEGLEVIALRDVMVWVSGKLLPTIQSHQGVIAPKKIKKS
jgi:hypothetical protein